LREVSIREGIELAENRNVPYLELSNVFEIDAILTGFEVIVSLIIHEREKEKEKEIESQLPPKPKKGKKKK